VLLAVPGLLRQLQEALPSDRDARDISTSQVQLQDSVEVEYPGLPKRDAVALSDHWCRFYCTDAGSWEQLQDQSPVQQLENQLQKCVEMEDYARAADLKTQLQRLVRTAGAAAEANAKKAS